MGLPTFCWHGPWAGLRMVLPNQQNRPLCAMFLRIQTDKHRAPSVSETLQDHFSCKKKKNSQENTTPGGFSWFLLVSHPSSLPHTKPRPANHGLLRGPIGRGQRGAAPVLVGRGAAEQGTGRGSVRIHEGQEGSSHALTTGIAWDDVYHGLKNMSCWGQNLDI